MKSARSRTSIKIGTRIAIIFLILVFVMELLARSVLDFPLYSADSSVGYWLNPDQSGSFLFKNDWAFNDKSMGVANKFVETKNFDLLLVGDSVVLGGNPLRQNDKLGPILSRNTGWSVWPISAGSWAMQNELAFLDRNSSILNHIDAIVFVFNSGDFGKPSSWSSEMTHPRSYPRSYLWYLFRKYFFRSNEAPTKQYRVAPRDVLQMWNNFNLDSKVPVIAIGYPALDELNEDCNWIPLDFKKAGHWFCYDASEQHFAGDYRDGIHPSKSGDEKLAKFLQAVIQKSMQGGSTKSGHNTQSGRQL